MTTSAIQFSSPIGWTRMMAAAQTPSSARSSGVGSSRLARIWGPPSGEAYSPVSPPGVIGAAVIRAARRSANLARRRLAQMLPVSQETVRSWETGTTPLFCAPYEQLRFLASALNEAGARVGWEFDEILVAAQCDLLITGMLHGFEDYAEVPPIEEDTPAGWAACVLLRWALTGMVPLRYRPHAVASQLLTEPDIAHVAAAARRLMLNPADSPLATFGAALASLTGG
jgi:transcriptional regulator with XRE-family HTH domain